MLIKHAIGKEEKIWNVLLFLVEREKIPTF